MRYFFVFFFNTHKINNFKLIKKKKFKENGKKLFQVELTSWRIILQCLYISTFQANHALFFKCGCLVKPRCHVYIFKIIRKYQLRDHYYHPTSWSRIYRQFNNLYYYILYIYYYLLAFFIKIILFFFRNSQRKFECPIRHNIGYWMWLSQISQNLWTPPMKNIRMEIVWKWSPQKLKEKSWQRCW